MASSGHLNPGEEGEILVSVDLKGKTGRIVKSVNVQTNDPVKPLVTLTVSVSIKAEQSQQK